MVFLETAQQLLFAQQFGLQPSALGAFERMHEAAGSWSGLPNMASTTANRIVAVFRIAHIYHKGPGASTLPAGGCLQNRDEADLLHNLLAST